MSDSTKIESFIQKDLDNHQMTAALPSRSWKFQHVREDERRQWCPYGFVFSWHPGQFAIMGDLGELQLTHYHAIDCNLETSLDWLATSGFDYLMSKSSVSQEFSAEHSAALIWDAIMERAVGDTRCYLEVIREWIDQGKPYPRPEPDPEIDRLFNALSDRLHGSYLQTEPRSAWRKELREQLVCWLSDSDGATQAYDIAYEILEDAEPYEYIGRDWPQGSGEKIGAMQFAARWILDNEIRRRAA